METAKRLDGIGEYYFSQKLREIADLNKAGKEVINLGIGSPDLPPSPEVIRVLAASAADPHHHAYQSYKGSIVLRKSFADWYARWYKVQLDPDTELLPLIGSKEGIMHICMAFLDPGDKVLVPDPGYPAYRAAATIAGATCIPYALTGDNGWLPELRMIEGKGVRMMFLNYPHMPSGKIATAADLKHIVDFATEHGILLVHDNPYGFLLPGWKEGERPLSILSIPGGKKVAIELNSLSKSHNMAGWRVGVLAGSSAMIDGVLRFKSNMDSGTFLPIQLAAATALGVDASWYEQLNAVYDQRRKSAFELLEMLGCSFDQHQAGLFVWGRIPDQYNDAFRLSDEILRGARVFITPGGIFGSNGGRYLRISLCADLAVFQKAMERISKWNTEK